MSKYHVKVIAGRGLDTTLVRSWKEIQHTNPALRSPYFAPEFTRIVAEVRDDVEVAIVSIDGCPVAFFPFQRKESNATEAVPVGDFICDFQGLICKPGFHCNPLTL